MPYTATSSPPSIHAPDYEISWHTLNVPRRPAQTQSTDALSRCSLCDIADSLTDLKLYEFIEMA